MRIRVRGNAAMTRYARAFAAGDPRVGGECRRFAGPRQIDGGIGVNRPRMVEVQIASGARHQRGISQTVAGVLAGRTSDRPCRSEEHTPELQSLMRSSYAVFWLKKH